MKSHSWTETLLGKRSALMLSNSFKKLGLECCSEGVLFIYFQKTGRQSQKDSSIHSWQEEIRVLTTEQGSSEWRNTLFDGSSSVLFVWGEEPKPMASDQTGWRPLCSRCSSYSWKGVKMSDEDHQQEQRAEKAVPCAAPAAFGLSLMAFWVSTLPSLGAQRCKWCFVVWKSSVMWIRGG